jgi:CMP-N-acetylneuraminic acid synthetase
MRVLGLINARGGSKSVPRKNIKPLLGKPLIVYSIEVGLAAKRIDRLVVSTDDGEIAGIARAAGADVPFLRPAELATDTALQIDAIRHAIASLEAEGDRFDAVAILQPTCPLRLPEDIDGALDMMERTQADTVITVCEVQGYHPLTMYTSDAAGRLSPLFEANRAGVLRQEFPTVLWRNGAIYGIRRDVVMQQGTLYGDRTVGFAMPAERSANIDEPIDWIITEALLRHRLDPDHPS